MGGEKHEVVVVPICWRGHGEKKELVDKICENVKTALMTRGIDCWVDNRRQYTPGQKFAYWEHLGVPLRIEVGEQEAAAKTCNIVFIKTPGAYKEHTRAKNVQLTAGAVLSQLKNL